MYLSFFTEYNRFSYFSTSSPQTVLLCRKWSSFLFYFPFLRYRISTVVNTASKITICTLIITPSHTLKNIHFLLFQNTFLYFPGNHHFYLKTLLLSPHLQDASHLFRQTFCRFQSISMISWLLFRCKKREFHFR